MNILPPTWFHSRFPALLPLSAALLAGSLAHDAAAQTPSSAAGSADSYFTAGGSTTNGTYLDTEGPGTTTPPSTFAEFGVVDFSTSSLNSAFQTATAIQNNQLTLKLTESDAAFTAPATLEFYLTTATGVSISSSSSLRYQPGSANSATGSPYGIDPSLGSLGAASGSPALFDLGSGSFTSTGTTNTGKVDSYTLNLTSTAAQTAFLNELNTVGSTVRLVAVVNSTAGMPSMPSGAGTFYGVGNSTVANRPTLSFNATYATTNGLYWQGGNGGSWIPSGGTNFSTSATPVGPPGTTGWINDGTATAIFANAANAVNINAGNINAAGLEFDVTGYAINGTGAGNTLTLTGSSHLVNVVNATDTATINAPILGTVGLNKVGPGTLVLGSTTNSFSGGVNIINGTVQISSDANLGASANGINLNGTSALNTIGSLALGAGRGLTGSGALGVTGTNTLTFNGAVAASNLTLTGSGTVVLANNALFDAGMGASNSISGVTFNVAGTTLSAPGETNTGNNLGLLTLGGVTIATGVTGAETINANVNLAMSTTSIYTVPTGTTLTINGDTFGSGKLTKQGSGLLVLAGTGASGLTQATGTVQQGSSGTTPVDGGIISLKSATSMPTGQFQANAGTLRNDTGAALVLPNAVSVGAQNFSGSGGLILTDTNGSSTTAGTNGITFQGAVTLFGGATTTYARYITANTPTTFSGAFLNAGSSGQGGLTFAGSSSVLFNSTTPSTLAAAVTIANAGGATAATTGTFGGSFSVTIAAGSTLTINTGVTGTVDTINDGGFVVLNGNSTTPSLSGKIVLTLTGTTENVGNLGLSVADTFMHNGSMVTLQPGFEPAGTYGAIGSGASYQNNDYFGGAGVLNNLATVPEPGTWATVLLGCAGLALVMRVRQARRTRI